MLFLFRILLAAAATTCALAADAPPSAIGKWLAEQDAQWQPVYDRDVEEAHAKALADLRKQYLGSLDAQILRAARESKLDEAVALRTEREAVQRGAEVPATSDLTTPTALQALRAGFAKALAALTVERAARARALHSRYDVFLAQSQDALTQRQRFDDALEIKVRREKLAATWLEASAETVPATVGAPPATPSKSAGFVPLSTVRSDKGMVFHVAGYMPRGSKGLTVFLNNKEVIDGVHREEASRVRVAVREGDILAIRLETRPDINSFWLSCLSSGGQFLFETSDKWMSYLPADSAKWWVIKDAKEVKPAIFAPDRQEYVDLVKRCAAQTPHYRGAQPIRSELADGSDSYLYYIVTRADLSPKSVNEPAGK